MECKNCQQPLTLSDKFCSDCGAKVIQNRITLRHVYSEMKENMFSLDTNKPLKTFIDLFARPEEVIGGYIGGVRKKYINAFGYFTIALTIFGLFIFFFSDDYSLAMKNIYTQQGQSQSQMQLSEKINNTVFEYQSLVFFIFIPLFAMISRLIFLKNKTYNYSEHLVINLYGQSHISITTTLLYFLTVWNEDLLSWVLMISIPFNIIYFAFILQRLYHLNFLQIILKTLLFLAVLIPIILILNMIIFAILTLTGVIDFQQFIEAEKARQKLSYIASFSINWTS